MGSTEVGFSRAVYNAQRVLDVLRLVLQSKQGSSENFQVANFHLKFT